MSAFVIGPRSLLPTPSDKRSAPAHQVSRVSAPLPAELVTPGRRLSRSDAGFGSLNFGGVADALGGEAHRGRTAALRLLVRHEKRDVRVADGEERCEGRREPVP